VIVMESASQLAYAGHDPADIIAADGVTLADALLSWQPPEWHAKAACRGMAGFLPQRGEWRQMRAAVAVCAGCPVRDRCLSEALDDPRLVGVWGGTTGRDRRAMRAERQPAA
jgi:WhiB family redox-sensing transcriptional regulator